MSDPRRDVAERLEKEAGTALRNAEVEEGWATSDAPANEEEARQISRWKVLALRNRRTAALMLEAAALLREPSEGREPDAELRRAAAEAWRTFNEEFGLLADVRRLGKQVVLHDDHDKAMWRLYEALGTPSDSPAGEP